MAANLPSSIPELPLDINWSYEVKTAHKIIADGYQSAYQTLRQENGDMFQLRYHAGQISKDFIPILKALEDDGVSIAFITSSAEAFGCLMVQLEKAAIGANREYVL